MERLLRINRRITKHAPPRALSGETKQRKFEGATQLFSQSGHCLTLRFIGCVRLVEEVRTTDHDLPSFLLVSESELRRILKRF